MKDEFIHELLMEAKSKFLKEYNHIKIKELTDKSEIIEKDLLSIQEIASSHEIDENLSKKYILLKNTLDYLIRVKRSYEYSRFLKIQEFVADNEQIPHSLTKDEEEHVQFFSQIYDDYKNNFKDLNFNQSEIPLNHFIHFVTLEDCGIVMDGDELYELKADRYFFMKRSCVEHLIGTSFIKIL